MILNFSSFVKTNIAKTSSFLIYGENQGRIEECSTIIINSMKKKFGAINQIYLSSDELKKGVFSKSYFDSNNHDLFGNKNIFIISLQDQKAAKEIAETLQIKKTSFAILIIKCVQLKKTSALRTFFEKSKENLIVPCYEENETDKKNMIMSFFSSAKLNISADEINVLSSLLSNERLEIKNELNKLIIFIKNSKKDVKDSLNIISENISENISQLIFSLASRDELNFLKNFFKSKDIRNDNVKLINSFSDHLLKILEVKDKIKRGHEKSFAIKALRPPIFFKYLNDFTRQVDLWEEKEINHFLRKLYICQSYYLKNFKSNKFTLYFLFLKILNLKKVI